MSCGGLRVRYIAYMSPTSASTHFFAFLLGIALALQGLVGCDVAHAPAVGVMAGHCDEMAMNPHDKPFKHKSPTSTAHDCAKMCHPVVAQAAMPQLASVPVHAPQPVIQQLDDLSGGSIQPATPPPRNS
jgi:hypothetical protein